MNISLYTMKLSSCSNQRWSSSICCCCIISLSSIWAWLLSCREQSCLKVFTKLLLLIIRKQNEEKQAVFNYYFIIAGLLRSTSMFGLHIAVCSGLCWLHESGWVKLPPAPPTPAWAEGCRWWEKTICYWWLQHTVVFVGTFYDITRKNKLRLYSWNK